MRGVSYAFIFLFSTKGAVITPKGYRQKSHRDIDWEARNAVALDAFVSKNFFVSHSGKDFQKLDDVVETPDVIEINFVKFNEIISG